MKRENLRRVLFTSAACLLAVPWLTPCGIGLVSSAVVRGTSHTLFGDPNPMARWPAVDVQNSGGASGRRLTVHQNQSVPRSLLISASEWQAVADQTSDKEAQSFSFRAATAMAQVADALETVDASVYQERQATSKPEPRKELALSNQPFVMLEGDDLRFARHGRKDLPFLALAATRTMLAKATIRSPDGTIFASAQRIHFRGPSAEIVLEGNPMVLFGRQQVKATRPDALMKLNFITRTVMVNGKAIETTF